MSPADEHPFLAAILAHAPDDGPRLVYADFLDDAGDPARAELVRLQVALHRLPADHPRLPALKDREAELLQQHRAAWAVRLGGGLPGVEVQFRRGLPDAVSVDAAAFLRRGDELFRRTRLAGPAGRSLVRRVLLLNPARVVAQLADSPLLAAVEELDLCGGDLGNAGVGRLVRSPHLRRVRALDLGFNGLDDAGVRALAAASTLPRLQVLGLCENRDVTWDGVRALAESPFFVGLTDLDLSGNVVNDAGVRALAAGRALPRLQALKLAENHIGDAGVTALVRAPLFRRLLACDPHLDLRRNAIGPAGVEALAACPDLARVVSLDLGANYLGDRGAAALAASGRLANLRALRLAKNQITDAGAAALAAAVAGAAKLRTLDVSGNRLTRRGVEALRAAAAGRGAAVNAAENGTEPSAPVAAADVVAGVVTDLVGADVDALRRRIAHPTRRS
jgi:uncharacterized protein (TIGR02996 family)